MIHQNYETSLEHQINNKLGTKKLLKGNKEITFLKKQC